MYYHQKDKNNTLKARKARDCCTLRLLCRTCTEFGGSCRRYFTTTWTCWLKNQAVMPCLLHGVEKQLLWQIPTDVWPCQYHFLHCVSGVSAESDPETRHPEADPVWGKCKWTLSLCSPLLRIGYWAVPVDVLLHCRLCHKNHVRCLPNIEQKYHYLKLDWIGFQSKAEN